MSLARPSRAHPNGASLTNNPVVTANIDLRWRSAIRSGPGGAGDASLQAVMFTAEEQQNGVSNVSDDVRRTNYKHETSDRRA